MLEMDYQHCASGAKAGHPSAFSKNQAVIPYAAAWAWEAHHRDHEIEAVSTVRVHLEASSVSHHMVLVHCIHTCPAVYCLLEPAVLATDF